MSSKKQQSVLQLPGSGKFVSDNFTDRASLAVGRQSLGDDRQLESLVESKQRRCCSCFRAKRQKKATAVSLQLSVVDDSTTSFYSSGNFVIQVEHPTTHQVHEFYAQTDEPELTLTNVMNWITFDTEQGDRFDANFISRRNEATQDFDYYVQRLMSVAVVDEYEPCKGPLWHVYINGVLEDWMQIVRMNRIVCK